MGAACANARGASASAGSDCSNCRLVRPLFDSIQAPYPAGLKACTTSGPKACTTSGPASIPAQATPRRIHMIDGSGTDHLDAANLAAFDEKRLGHENAAGTIEPAI